MQLNKRAHVLVQKLLAEADALRVDVTRDTSGATIIDLGIKAQGGLEAGLRMAEICLAGLGRVTLAPSSLGAGWRGPQVTVATDHPVAACMASQYAGWQIAAGKYFAMGSGPMRAAAGQEKLFTHIGFQEQAESVVGVLEASKLPTSEVIADLARQCAVAAENVTLLVARTASQAGNVQVVARSVETALHKLHELGFDMTRLVSGWGTAPLPPVAANDLAGIGRTNDAILYGGEVTLWVRGDDESLLQLGPSVPSNASQDHGQPFAAIFERYDRDFYKIDPLLFSPAVVTFANLDSGRVSRFGTLCPDILEQSFQS